MGAFQDIINFAMVGMAVMLGLVLAAVGAFVLLKRRTSFRGR